MTSTPIRFLMLAATCIAAVPQPVVARDPHALDYWRCPYTTDGACPPSRQTYGYHAAKWRRWPGVVDPIEKSQPLPQPLPAADNTEPTTEPLPQPPSDSTAPSMTPAQDIPLPGLEGDDVPPVLPQATPEQPDLESLPKKPLDADSTEDAPPEAPPETPSTAPTKTPTSADDDLFMPDEPEPKSTKPAAEKPSRAPSNSPLEEDPFKDDEDFFETEPPKKSTMRPGARMPAMNTPLNEGPLTPAPPPIGRAATNGSRTAGKPMPQFTDNPLRRAPVNPFAARSDAYLAEHLVQPTAAWEQPASAAPPVRTMHRNPLRAE